MGFEIKLTAHANERLLGFPPHLRNFVEDHLRRLGASPGSLSRLAASPPHPPGGMISEADYVVGAEWHHISIFYRYSQDETALIVVAIGHVDYSPGP